MPSNPIKHQEPAPYGSRKSKLGFRFDKVYIIPSAQIKQAYNLHPGQSSTSKSAKKKNTSDCVTKIKVIRFNLEEARKCPWSPSWAAVGWGQAGSCLRYLHVLGAMNQRMNQSLQVVTDYKMSALFVLCHVVSIMWRSLADLAHTCYRTLTDLSGIRPRDRLVRRKRREERVWELGHEHIHVEDGVHLHWGGRVAAPARAAAGESRCLVLLVEGHTEDVGMHFAKKWELLLCPLWEGKNATVQARLLDKQG